MKGKTQRKTKYRRRKKFRKEGGETENDNNKTRVKKTE